MIKRLIVSLSALALSTSLALAGEDHDHAAKNGGVVEHTGHHHLELVADGSALTLYVRNEDGSEEDASAAKATATVLSGGKTEQVTLAPAGGNGLKGAGGFTAGKGTTVVVSLTMPGHETEQVRFQLD